jgi:hypothetical protein
LEDIEFGKQVDPYSLADLWTANNDARSYVVLGDPAARVPAGRTGELPAERPVIQVSRVGGKIARTAGVRAAGKAPGEEPEQRTGGQSLDVVTPSAGMQVEGVNVRAVPLAGVDERLLTLTVSTYAAANVDRPAERELKFRTTVSLLGDVETALPAEVPAEDLPYLEWHRELVKTAWAGRWEQIKLIVNSRRSASEATGEGDLGD